MQTSQRGIDLIKSFEGLKLVAYQDAVGVWTIGYGHTGPDVTPGLKITAGKAEELLRNDLRGAERDVTRLVGVDLTQGQFDALVSFTFNVGGTNLAKSSLLRLINTKHYDLAAQQFPKWNLAGGKVLPGLTRRRLAEQKLFLS